MFARYLEPVVDRAEEGGTRKQVAVCVSSAVSGPVDFPAGDNARRSVISHGSKGSIDPMGSIKFYRLMFLMWSLQLRPRSPLFSPANA